VNVLLYTLFGMVFVSGYLADNLGKIFNLVPELLSSLILLFVVLKIGADRSISISRGYVILGIVVSLHVVVGLLINLVAPGTILNGLRPYLKLIPIFLLPAVYQVSEMQMRRQLKFVLMLTVLQFPVAFYQRLVEFRGVPTGDVITGTLGFGGSGALSFLLVAGIAVLFSFYLAGHIKTIRFLLLASLLFLPTTINETKVTLVLIPVALLLPLIYARGRHLRARHYAAFGAAAVVLIAGYVAIYDYVAAQLGREQLVSFVGSKKNATRYFYIGSDQGLEALKERSVGDVRLPPEKLSAYDAGRRLDNLILPLRYHYYNDPVRLWVGAGLGNTSESFIKQFSGELGERVGESGKDMLMSLILWETGIGGVLFFLVFMYFLFRDAHRLAQQKTAATTFAIGWLAVLAMTLLTSAYINILYANALGYLLAYFSGYVAAERYRMSVQGAVNLAGQSTAPGAASSLRGSDGAGTTLRMR